MASLPAPPVRTSAPKRAEQGQTSDPDGSGGYRIGQSLAFGRALQRGDLRGVCEVGVGEAVWWSTLSHDGGLHDMGHVGTRGLDAAVGGGHDACDGGGRAGIDARGGHDVADGGELLRLIVVEAVALFDTLVAMAAKTSAELAPTAETWVTVLWTWMPAERMAAAARIAVTASATGS